MSEIVLVDLDSVEIVEAVERAFRIKIADEEAVACRTVGDLFGLVTQKIPTVDRGTSACHAALCFWKLHAALPQRAQRGQITPTTRLADLMPVGRRRAWRRRLERLTNLVLPSSFEPNQSRRRWLNGLITGVSFGTALAGGAGGWAILVGVTTMLFLALVGCGASKISRMDAGTTVGDFAKITASLNAGQLAAQYGPIRKSEAWDALVGVIRNFTGYPGPIDKRTRFRCV